MGIAEMSAKNVGAGSLITVSDNPTQTCADQTSLKDAARYAPEMVVAALTAAVNIALVTACTRATIRLYELGAGGHSFWPLLGLLLMGHVRFIRD